MSSMQIHAPKGANKNKKRLGKGTSSGTGKTSGKGHKGQKSRSGGGVTPGFEGGQMPLFRRVAARGFSNYPFKKTYVVVNLGQLEKNFSDGETVNQLSLVQKGILKKSETLVKVLGDGELSKKLDVDVSAVSQSAKENI
jgi:large subunit ribosomal protein L15